MKNVQCLKVVRFLVFAMLTAGLTAGVASAQNYVGKVTLPVKTVWGNAQLPAGEYSFVLDPSVPSVVQIRRGDERLALIPTTGGTQQDSSFANSELVGVRKGNLLRISMVRLAEVHLVMNYSQPRGVRTYIADKEPEFIQRVAVTRKGK
ncbi:MAG TPA: hypothetical protein VG028_21915 [Terriglobia bacterium]|nr:hypothetical protein [Terriglobia bacterium]